MLQRVMSVNIFVMNFTLLLFFCHTLVANLLLKSRKSILKAVKKTPSWGGGGGLSLVSGR